MSFTSLPLKPRNEFTSYYVDQKYTYLVLSKVEKLARRSKKTENDYKKWENQQETLKRLETGHFNCYNAPIEPSNIINELEWIVNNFDHYIIFKIKPTSSYSDNGSYYTSTKWRFFEFDVVKKIETIEDLYKCLYNDYIMNEILAKLIDNCKYNNHIAEWDGIWKTIKTAIPDIGEHICFSDIIKSFNDNKMESKDTILYNLMTNDEIRVVSDCDSKYGELLERAFVAGLYKSMVLYTVRKLDVMKNIELSQQDIVLLQKHTDNLDVAELVNILKLKFPGMKLIIKKIEYYNDGYASHESQEEVNVKDIGEAKMYIARNFNVSFSELQKDINKIDVRDEDVEYEFELLTN